MAAVTAGQASGGKTLLRMPWKGAIAVVGGGRNGHPGAFVQPTILTGVTPRMRAYHEELFGPVAVVYRVQDDAEAVALANTSLMAMVASRAPATGELNSGHR
jgi:acyl-CoA reductase-like NAD-dependent aldehyde dehydrogenase